MVLSILLSRHADTLKIQLQGLILRSKAIIQSNLSDYPQLSIVCPCCSEPTCRCLEMLFDLEPCEF